MVTGRKLKEGISRWDQCKIHRVIWLRPPIWRASPSTEHIILERAADLQVPTLRYPERPCFVDYQYQFVGGNLLRAPPLGRIRLIFFPLISSELE